MREESSIHIDSRSETMTTTAETGASTIRSEKIFEVKEHIGESFASREIRMSRDRLKLFLEATGDTNPIHFDAQGAKKSVFSEVASGEIIMPGFLTLSLCAHEETLYKALLITEPHEIISLGLEDVNFLAPVPINSNVVYEYRLRNAKKILLKSRPGIKVDWDITAYRVFGEDKTPCMKASWSLAYVSLGRESQ